MSDPLRPAISWGDALIRINELTSELQAKKEIIKKLEDYVTHMNSCSWRNGLAGKPSNHCDCGLEEALALIEKGD